MILNQLSVFGSWFFVAKNERRSELLARRHVSAPFEKDGKERIDHRRVESRKEEKESAVYRNAESTL